MRYRNWLAMTMICTGAYLGGPLASASASCDTLANCVIEQVLAAPNTVIGAAEDEATCLQSQILSPDPNNGDTVCKAVGTTITTTQQEAGWAETELGCVQAQIGNPDSHGDDLCKTAGALLGTLRYRAVVCVLQGRLNGATATASGYTNCISNVSTRPGDVANTGYTTGTFSLPGAVALERFGPPGSGLYYSLGTVSGTLTAGPTAYSVWFEPHPDPNGLSATHDGYWLNDSAPHEGWSRAVFHAVRAQSVDPSAAYDDFFVNGVTVFGPRV